MEIETWPSVTPKEALDDIEMMCEKILTRKNVMTESLEDGDESSFFFRKRARRERLKRTYDTKPHHNKEKESEWNTPHHHHFIFRHDWPMRCRHFFLLFYICEIFFFFFFGSTTGRGDGLVQMFKCSNYVQHATIIPYS